MLMEPPEYLPPDEMLMRQLGQFIPTTTWFEQPNEGRVAVQVFRVHRVAFADTQALPSASLIIDFSEIQARAVFGRGEIIHPDHESAQLFPTPDGGSEIRMQAVWTVPLEEEEQFMRRTDRELWRSTGDGVMLVLLTSLDANAAHDNESAVLPQGVREKLTLARAAIIAMLERNTAFEQLLETKLTFSQQGARMDGLSAMRFSPESFDPPRLDGFGAALAEEVVARVQSLDARMRNRVLLALRWYLLAQRHPLPREESMIDVFINYWVALEALAMPDQRLSTITRIFAEIHDRTAQEVGQLLPIGRIFGLRGRVLHRGETPELRHEVLQLMDAVFVDVLVHTLDIDAVPKTSVYMDGSGNDLVP